MAPGQGSKPRYCLNPTGNKEGAGKAADGCLKYVPIQTFLSYQLGFVSESEKPLKTRGSKRSVEDPQWCCSPFPRETSTRTRSRTISHTGRRMADSEKLLLSFLLPLCGSREVFKDDTGVRRPGALVLLLPRRRNARRGRHGAVLAHADRPHGQPASHVGRKTAAGPPTPAGHIAGQKNWEGPWEKMNDPGLTVLFHITTGTQQVCRTDARTAALALSCTKEIRSVVVVLGCSQFPPVSSGRVWWTIQFYSLKNKAAAGF